MQGVFFRGGTAITARELGVLGWVKNLGDGRVEAIVEGGEEQVKKLIDWMKNIKFPAKVEDIEVKWEEYKNEFIEFSRQ